MTKAKLVTDIEEMDKQLKNSELPPSVRKALQAARDNAQSMIDKGEFDKDLPGKKALKPAAVKSPKAGTMEDCEEIIKRYEKKVKKDKARANKREKAGKPKELTVAETVNKAAKSVGKKIKEKEEKGKSLSKRDSAMAVNSVMALVRKINGGIEDKKDQLQFLDDLIEALTASRETHRPRSMASGGIFEETPQLTSYEQYVFDRFGKQFGEFYVATEPNEELDKKGMMQILPAEWEKAVKEWGYLHDKPYTKIPGEKDNTPFDLFVMKNIGLRRRQYYVSDIPIDSLESMGETQVTPRRYNALVNDFFKRSQMEEGGKTSSEGESMTEYEKHLFDKAGIRWNKFYVARENNRDLDETGMKRISPSQWEYVTSSWHPKHKNRWLNTPSERDEEPLFKFIKEKTGLSYKQFYVSDVPEEHYEKLGMTRITNRQNFDLIQEFDRIHQIGKYKPNEQRPVPNVAVANMRIFHYHTEHFNVSPGARQFFEYILSQDPSGERTKSLVVAMAKDVDDMLGKTRTALLVDEITEQDFITAAGKLMRAMYWSYGIVQAINGSQADPHKWYPGFLAKDLYIIAKKTTKSGKMPEIAQTGSHLYLHKEKAKVAKDLIATEAAIKDAGGSMRVESVNWVTFDMNGRLYEIARRDNKYQLNVLSYFDEFFEKKIDVSEDPVDLVKIAAGRKEEGGPVGEKMRHPGITYGGMGDQYVEKLSDKDLDQINSTLSNDDEGTDEEIIEFFMDELDLDQETAKYLVTTYRPLFNTNPLFEIDKYRSREGENREGGKVTFADKVTAVKKNLEGKPVPVKFQNGKTGKRYTKKSAEAAAKKIIGSRVLDKKKPAKKGAKKMLLGGIALNTPGAISLMGDQDNLSIHGAG